MPRAEAGTPKALSRAMKAKGLQKLKWYCQMCQKQCRDENGFKCHMLSESHQRQMKVFSENSGHFIGEYSKDFERGFLDLMKRRFFSKRIQANKVYVEYIANRDHVHMNSTRWSTLTGFCEYLNKTGKVEIERTEKGVYIKYIDRSPEAIAKQAEEEKRAKLELKNQKKQEKLMEKQLELAVLAQKKLQAQNENMEGEGLVKEEELNDGNNENSDSQVEEDLLSNENKEIKDAENMGGSVPTETEKPKVEINFSFKKKQHNKDDEKHLETEKTDNPFGNLLERKRSEESKISFSFKKTEPSSINEKRKNVSAVDKLLENIKDSKKLHFEGLPSLPSKSKEQESGWIVKDIIVKIKDKELLNGKYFNKKGVILRIIDKFVAEIKILSKEEIIRVDQAFLETVIPKIGGDVVILKQGPDHLKTGLLESIHMDSLSGSVFIVEEDKAVELPFDLFSKKYDEKEK